QRSDHNFATRLLTLALDRQKHLIKMPLVAGPRTAATQLIGILLAKFATPFADGLIGALSTYSRGRYTQRERNKISPLVLLGSQGWTCDLLPSLKSFPHLLTV